MRQMRLTQALVDRLPPRTDEMGPVRDSHVPEDHAARTAAALIARLPEGEDLWVFAVGSLIWNPRFEVAERRLALVRGWHRAFCFGPTRRGRGSPSAPGLMLSLDRGGQCRGVALRMPRAGIAAQLEALLKTEPPTPPRFVRAVTDAGPVPAIAFTAEKSYWAYCPEPPEDEVADTLARAVGHRGTMAEYLLNTVTHLEAAGVHDPYLWRLQAKVADRLERLPARG